MHPESEARSPPPRGSGDRVSGSLTGILVLRLIKPFAVVAVLATIVGRMAAPAAAGLAVGTGRLVQVLEIAGAVLSQLFAIAAVTMTLALLGAVARSSVAYGLRVGAIIVGSFVLLLVLSATVRRLPGALSALIGVGAVVIALGAAWDARRAPFARPAALVLGLIALAALIRLAGVALAFKAVGAPSWLATAARGIATAAFLVDGLAVLTAIAALALRGGGQVPGGEPGGAEPERRPLASPWTIAVLALAMLATRQALSGASDEAGAFDVLLRRGLDRLITRPPPLLPQSLQLFAAALSVAVALLALLSRRGVPALSGALALLLITRSAPDVPLGALSLIIAGFAVALAARDERGLWAALLAGRGGVKERPRSVDAAKDTH